jgi:hypothetical protein
MVPALDRSITFPNRTARESVRKPFSSCLAYFLAFADEDDDSATKHLSLLAAHSSSIIVNRSSAPAHGSASTDCYGRGTMRGELFDA